MKKFLCNSKIVYHNHIAKPKLMGYAYMQSCIYFLDCLKSPSSNMLKVFMGTPKIPSTVSYAHNFKTKCVYCDEINDSWDIFVWYDFLDENTI